LLKEQFGAYIDSINEDALFTQNFYLSNSTGDALGIDLSQLTSEETLQFLQDTVPGVNSVYADLSQTLLEQGGIIKASAEYFEQLSDAVREATAAQN